MVSNPSIKSSIFGKRLREVRLQNEIPHDKLGVMSGLDEGSSSARMSRYENGVHEPPFQLVMKLAEILHVPTAYFYCGDDRLAELMRIYNCLTEEKRVELLQAAKSMSKVKISEDKH